MGNIRADDLLEEIKGELEEYRDEITDVLKEGVGAAGRLCLKEVKGRSPERTKAYKKGWRLGTVYESGASVRVVVYNKAKPQLTHLLEYGHDRPGGGRTEGVPHIRLAEQAAEKELKKRVEIAVGGKV